jgi:hypothetical protein
MKPNIKSPPITGESNSANACEIKSGSESWLFRTKISLAFSCLFFFGLSTETKAHESNASFYEDFSEAGALASNPDKGWVRGEIANQPVFQRKGSQPWDYISLPGVRVEGDFAMDFRFLFPATTLRRSNDNFFTSIWFRLGTAQTQNGYLLSIRPHFWELRKRVNGEYFDLDSRAFSTEVDLWYDVRIRCEGNEIAVLLNGNPILSARDETFTGGTFGISNANDAISFERIRIGPITSPPFAPIPGTAPVTITSHPDSGLPGRTGHKGLIRSGLLESEIEFVVYHQANELPKETVPYGILYLKNLPGERIGQEPDESIIADYIAQGYTVITLDYDNDPRAISPELEKEVSHFLLPREENRGCRRPDPLFFDGLAAVFRPSRVYVLPPGYRVQNNIPYFDLIRHGPHGTEEKLVDHWNSRIVPARQGYALAKSFADLHMANGDPVDPVYRMDIIYPSQAAEGVPLMVRFATDLAKDPNAGNQKRWHFIGFTLRGGAYASVGHPYDPLYFDYWRELGSNAYGLSNHLGLAAGQAVLRQLAARAEELNIDPERFFGHGHSKGQYFVTRMLNPDHENHVELTVNPDYPPGSPEPQPFAGYPARIKAGYQSAGSGNFYYNRRDAAENPILVPDYLPTLIAVGEHDPYPVVPPYHRFVAKLKEIGVSNFTDLFMPGLAHDLPYGWNPDIERDNYEVYIEFFQKHGGP